MLELFIDFICALSLALLGFYINKRIIDSNSSLTKINVLILLINSISIVIIHMFKTSCIISYLINVVTYKLIFKKRMEEIMIAVGILMLLIVVADISFIPFLSIFSSLKSMINNNIIYLISNFSVMLITLVLFRIKFIYKIMKKSYENLIRYDSYINIIFIIIILIAITFSIYNMYINNFKSLKIINDLLLEMVAVILAVIYGKRQENYIILSEQYNSLFDYVQNYEEWIEKEQFTRHEYKNQLAVIYALSSEKDVKNKVKEILDNSINIDDNQIHQLKVLPKGGLKGLMYYKTSMAKKYKIKLTIDVSINNNGILQRLSKKKINELTKILGIYYDNAIEAARESRKKKISLEIYEMKDRVNIVISNTYKKESIINEMASKGVSSKGKGRGNGLYYANKILSTNDWIQTKQEIIDNYYIETITVTKNTSK